MLSKVGVACLMLNAVFGFQHKNKHKKQQPAVNVKFDDREVEFRGAKVKGRNDDDVDAFYGIRFGGQPKRWHDAEIYTDWSDIENFSNPSFDQCAQKYVPNSDFLNGQPQVVGSEDCLKMNIWKPANAQKGDDLAVMVFIHGGGAKMGGIATEGENVGPHTLLSTGFPYTGQNLVEDTIVVTIQYRLGVFGFLGSDKLRHLNELGSTANYGINDQRLALKWVSEYIESFGGDKNNVMIFGESAGADSVSAHAVSDLSWPYFHRAALESGAFSRQILQGMDTTESMFDILAKDVCPDVVSNTTALIDCLTNASMEDLYLAPGFDVQLTVDGVIIKETYDQSLQASPPRVHDIPYLMGSNSGDGSLMVSIGGMAGGYAMLPNVTTRDNIFDQPCVGPNVDTPYNVTDAYGTGETQQLSLLDVFALDQLEDTTPPRAMSDVLNEWYWTSNAIAGAQIFMCPTIDAAREMSSSPDFTNDIYVYEFLAVNDFCDPIICLYDTDPQTGTRSLIPGSGGPNHAAELVNVFGSSQKVWDAMAVDTNDKVTGGLALPGVNASLEQINNLSKKMSGAWINFAKTGTPGDDNWKPWSNDSPTKAVFDYNLRDEDMYRPVVKELTQCDVNWQAWNAGKCGPYLEY